MRCAAQSEEAASLRRPVVVAAGLPCLVLHRLEDLLHLPQHGCFRICSLIWDKPQCLPCNLEVRLDLQHQV
jgi:hypothetical protein